MTKGDARQVYGLTRGIFSRLAHQRSSKLFLNYLCSIRLGGMTVGKNPWGWRDILRTLG